MSSKSERKSISDKTALERDAERTITDLLLGKEAREPIRIGKKIIQTARTEVN